VGRALFGSDLTGDAEQLGRTMDAGQRVAVLATFVPLAWGPRSTRTVRAIARRAGHSPEGIDGPVGRIIAGRRSAAGPPIPATPNPAAATDLATTPNPAAATDLATTPNPAATDLLDVLMGARAADGSPLTDAEIADEVATFMLAGHETTANTLCWTLALLSAYPSARTQLEAELETVLGDRDPDAGDAEKLPWTRAVVAEAMRLYPPAWTIERGAVADDEVSGVPIPAGSLVAIPPYLVHRHRDFWADPAGFDPARFLPEAGVPGHRYAYIPFGGGRRACVGASFAELETVLVLATIARRYRLELTVTGVPAPLGNITLRPGRRLPMRLLRRP
jgi:cytochrome P450